MTEQDSLFRETLFPVTPSDLREWKGSGGPCGLQNRCPDVIHREVGSTPIHSRQLSLAGRGDHMAEERIVVYTLGECPACEKLRASYHAGGIPFEERRVDQDQRWYEPCRIDSEEADLFRRLAQRPEGPARVLALAEDWCPDVYRGLPV